MTFKSAHPVPSTGITAISACSPMSVHGGSDVTATRDEMTRVMLALQDRTMSHWTDDCFDPDDDEKDDDDPFGNDLF